MDREKRMEVLLIGLDAGCRRVLDPLFEADAVPHLQSIFENGVSGALESQIPPWTPSAWPSLYTGVNPGKHGVYTFTGFDGYDFHVVSARDVREHRLWTLLDDHDRSSVVVNVPVTHPPDEFDGAIVPGFIGPENPGCHPPDLLSDVREAIGEYYVYPNYTRGDDTISDEEKLGEYRHLVGMRADAFRYLADRFDPDFGFLQFQKPDTVFHEFEGDWDAVRTVYRETDKRIGEVLEDCDPDRVFVASDHGMGPMEKGEFRVNAFLQREGYIETKKGGKGMPTWNVLRDDLREGEDKTEWEPGTVERLASIAAKAGVTTNRVGNLLESVGLADVAARHVPSGVVRTGNEQVDFAASTAYMRARTELGVRINLRGRDPEGVVPPGKYDAVRENLIEDLSEVTGPDGEPVFGEVVPREEYYDGPFTDDAVDVLTIPNDFQYFLSAELREELFSSATEPWNHKLDGVFVATGEGIDTDAEVDRAHLYDVAPTIMAALGVPYSDRMDGEVIPCVDDAGSQSYPAYSGAGGEGTAEADVEDRLSDLGYLE